MVDFLKECNNRANRPWIVQAFTSSAKYQADIALMRETAEKSKQSLRAVPYFLMAIILTRCQSLQSARHIP